MFVYGAHTSVLCTVPSNHAGIHAYSRGFGNPDSNPVH